jgi:hypothetical protein
MAMNSVEWRFSNGRGEGDAWLDSPSAFMIYVDYQTTRPDGRAEWRRIMVVTRGWMEQQLANVRDTTPTPCTLVIPTALVIPDEKGAGLESILSRAIQHEGLDHYSEALTN